MEVLIIVVLLIILLAIWIVSTQQKLAVMNENINNAMGQIGVQLSSRFDALISLLDLTKCYAEDEFQGLILTVQTQRSSITAQSKPKEVLRQEQIISEILGRIIMIAEHCPELKADKNYIRYMDAVDCYERMIHTSCLIYNDSVTKFNQSFWSVPTNLIARLLGFYQQEYLETSIRNKQL